MKEQFPSRSRQNPLGRRIWGLILAACAFRSAATVPFTALALQAKAMERGIGVAHLNTQSPPPATTNGRIIRANDPMATAIYGHGEPVPSFEFPDWERHCHR